MGCNNGALTAKRRGGDLGNRNRRGIGRQNRLGLGNLRKAGEDVGFEVGDFRNSFDDEIGGVEGVD